MVPNRAKHICKQCSPLFQYFDILEQFHHTTGLFLYPLKIRKALVFFDVYMGYKNETLPAKYVLNRSLQILYTCPLAQFKRVTFWKLNFLTHAFNAFRCPLKVSRCGLLTHLFPKYPFFTP